MTELSREQVEAMRLEWAKIGNSVRLIDVCDTALSALDRLAAAEARIAEMDGLLDKELFDAKQRERAETAEAQVGALRKALRACVDCEVTNVSSGHPPFPALCASHRAEAQVALAQTAAAADAFVAGVRRDERERCAKVAEYYAGAGLDHDIDTQLGDAIKTKRDIAAAIRSLGEGGKGAGE